MGLRAVVVGGAELRASEARAQRKSSPSTPRAVLP